MSDITAITDITDTMNNESLTFDTLTVSQIIGVQESTIRKYCTLMQKYRYTFNKNSVGRRVFYAKDIEVIKSIAALKNTSTLTLEQAVHRILNADIDDITNTEAISNHDQLLQQFAEFKQQQIQFNQKLLEQLDQQQTYIKHSIEERDQLLMQSLKESMESRKQLAITLNEIEQQNQRKKSRWLFWK